MTSKDIELERIHAMLVFVENVTGDTTQKLATVKQTMEVLIKANDLNQESMKRVAKERNQALDKVLQMETKLEFLTNKLEVIINSHEKTMTDYERVTDKQKPEYRIQLALRDSEICCLRHKIAALELEMHEQCQNAGPDNKSIKDELNELRPKYTALLVAEATLHLDFIDFKELVESKEQTRLLEGIDVEHANHERTAALEAGFELRYQQHSETLKAMGEKHAAELKIMSELLEARNAGENPQVDRESNENEEREAYNTIMESESRDAIIADLEDIISKQSAIINEKNDRGPAVKESRSSRVSRPKAVFDFLAGEQGGVRMLCRCHNWVLLTKLAEHVHSAHAVAPGRIMLCGSGCGFFVVNGSRTDMQKHILSASCDRRLAEISALGV